MGLRCRVLAVLGRQSLSLGWGGPCAVVDPETSGVVRGDCTRGVDGGRRPHLLRPEGAPKRAVWVLEGAKGLTGPI